MALYALNNQGSLVKADKATALDRYYCLECHCPVQKRIGLHRQAHFFHLETSLTCRLHSRSSDHMCFQKFLYEKNSALQIERPFEKILRIADLCWEEKKIIFEIQCSPIDPLLARQRKNDYAKEGYDLIWLINDRHYHRHKNLRPEETVLRESGYYFSLSQKTVYDQFEVLFNRSRIAKGPPLIVDLTHVSSMPTKKNNLTKQIDSRTQRHFFGGDLFDRISRYPQYLRELQKHEEMIINSVNHQGRIILEMKKMFYTGLEFLLRHSSRD